MYMDSHTNDIGLTELDNYDHTLQLLRDYNLRKITDLLLAGGYTLFGVVSLFSLKDTRHDPILLIKNVLFCVAFLGIAYEYYLKYAAQHTIKFEHDIVSKFVFYNICIVLYGLTSIFYRNTKYHMHVFYRPATEKPAIHGLEIDALLTFISHALLTISAFMTTNLHILLMVVYVLLLISFSMSFISNILTQTVQNRALYYAIAIGSCLMIIGYIYELVEEIKTPILISAYA